MSCGLRTLCSGPETPTKWKSESVTGGGARDASNKSGDRKGVLSKWRPVIQVLYVIVRLTDPPCCIGLLLPSGISLVFKTT